MSPVPAGLVEAFWAHERALTGHALDALDALLAPGPGTLRGDDAGLLVGHDAVRAVRRRRGAAPERRIVQTHVQTIDDDHALVVAVTELDRGGRGQQTQLWRRLPSGWVVAAEHDSAPPPAMDSRIWRVVGDPLVAPPARVDDGPLAGETVAVKDLFAVTGHRVGAGNPRWLESAPVETSYAGAVAALLAAGASVRGIARADELGYSLDGTNRHTGAPPNPRAPHRVPGGSSSGSASAVSLGQATIGLGTDTAGSIRVPAAYQGLWGVRTTHDAVPREGLLALAPSFDAVGWLARDPRLLAAVGDALLPPDAEPAPPFISDDLVAVGDLLDRADPEVADAVRAWLPDPHHQQSWPADVVADLPVWREAFVTCQSVEAWATHGAWLEAAPARLASLDPGIRSRFERGRDLTGTGEADEAVLLLEKAADRIRDLVGHQVTVLPAAPTVAPPVGATTDRDATLTLTCLASIAGLPALVVPLTTRSGLPAGACLLAAPGRDRALLGLAQVLAPDR